MNGDLRVTGDREADEFVSSDAFALVVAMLLDQQVPLGWAFRGPTTLRERLGFLDPVGIAAMDPDDLVEVACRVPAIHRFPAVMARRIHAVATCVVDDYGGDTARIWDEAKDSDELYRRLVALPGFGDEKAKILIAILAKRFGVRPPGWKAAASPFSDSVPRSAADVDGPAALAEVKAWKRQQRAAGKSKQD
ncbi:MAG: HhH-GPD-type base excision DNA repair protein [Acidimicrobiia bacterium]